MCLSDKSGAIQTILKVLAEPSDSESSEEHPIDIAPTSRLYKTLLQGGHFNHTTKAIEQVPVWDSAEFAAQFVEVVGKDTTLSFCTGKGSGVFVIAELCEALIRGEKKMERSRVKAWFDDKVLKEIHASEVKGKDVLLEKLKLL